MCGERTGAVVLWQPSHHPSGCCTLVVVEESNYIRREGFLQTQTNHSTCGLRRIDVLLDFWRGARQVWRWLRRRPVRLCVGYGVG